MTLDPAAVDPGWRGSALASTALLCIAVVAFCVAGAGAASALDHGAGSGSGGVPAATLGEDEPGDDDREDEEEAEDEAPPSILGDWWGLDDDEEEAPFLGLVQLGTVALVVGAGGYALNKRRPFVPVRYRRRTLQVHEWMMLTGTALVAPHFLFAEEFEGLGLFVGLLLGVEVLSGFYGRHLHRRVIRLSRGGEAPAVVGRVLETTNERLFSRWRRIHVGLVSITALALLVHIVSAA